MAFGLLSTGLVTQTIDEIRAEINQTIWDVWPGLDLSDEDPLGQIIGIIAERELLIQQQAEVIYYANDVDKNTGASQDATAALTGTIRIKAAPSKTVLVLTGTDATSIAALSEVSVNGSGDRFSITDSQVLADAPAWAGSTGYAVDTVRNNGGNCYICTVAGTSAASGGPTSELSSITDNTVTWRFLGNGTAFAEGVAAESVDDGPVSGLSGTINVIESPVSGWDSCINLLDVTLGNLLESDEAMRIRRENEIASAGKATVDAVQAALLRVADVTSVRNFWNVEPVADADGVPAHGLESLVTGGIDQDIIDVLGGVLSGGTNTSGNVSGTWEDSEGNSHSISFSRTTDIDIYASVTLTYGPDYPSDGDTQVAAAIAASGNEKGAGADVTSSAVAAYCFAVPGVLDVTLAYIDITAVPVSETTLTITTREEAIFDTSRIVVNSSVGTV